MSICKLSKRDGIFGWCEEHEMYHPGHMADFALDPGPVGQEFRKIWTNMKNGSHEFPALKYQQSIITPGGKLRRKELALRCLYQGEHLSIPEARQRGLMENHCCGGSFAYQCSKRGHTNLNQCCDCNDFQERPVNNASEPTRHLLYHLWPKRMAFGIWQRNLDQLKQRWQLFNGKRVIAVATSSDSATLAQIQEYMQGYDCEWVHVENDPGLREVKTFYALFNAIRNCDGDNHFTFYGQGKGATKVINRMITIHDWTTAMYHLCLDYWPLVSSLLEKFPVVGSFKKNNWYGFVNSQSSWHYSGSFCWIRNKDLFALPDWSRIDRDWFGIESWLSLHFKQDKAGVIFYERKGDFDLYKMSFWKIMAEKLATWIKENRQYLSLNGVAVK